MIFTERNLSAMLLQNNLSDMIEKITANPICGVNPVRPDWIKIIPALKHIAITPIVNKTIAASAHLLFCAILFY